MRYGRAFGYNKLSMHTTEKRTITRVRDARRTESEDLAAIEKRVRVKINGRELFSLYASPVMIRELVTGFIATEGLIKGGFCTERMSIEYGEEIVVDVPAEGEIAEFEERPTITSGCAGGITYGRYEPAGTAGETKIAFEDLKELFTRFQQGSKLYRETGCIHSAALCEKGAILCLAEDIGRHNAVDKLIGYSILEAMPLKDKILLSSGRLSSEIAGKCAKWAIPIIASRTAATGRAMDIAEKAGITLVGFLRGAGCNIYTHPERITE